MLLCDFQKQKGICKCVRCGFLDISGSDICTDLWRKCDVQDTTFTSNNNTSPNIELVEEAAEKLGIIWQDAVHYTAALIGWSLAGFPTRDKDITKHIEEQICKTCTEYLKGRCKACRCRVNKSIALVNKIRMATEKCPKDKW